MDEPWKHYAKWKKAVTKDHILYEYLYEISRIRQINTDGKQISDCLGLGRWEEGVW